MNDCTGSSPLHRSTYNTSEEYLFAVRCHTDSYGNLVYPRGGLPLLNTLFPSLKWCKTMSWVLDCLALFAALVVAQTKISQCCKSRHILSLWPKLHNNTATEDICQLTTPTSYRLTAEVPAETSFCVAGSFDLSSALLDWGDAYGEETLQLERSCRDQMDELKNNIIGAHGPPAPRAVKAAMCSTVCSSFYRYVSLHFGVSRQQESLAT
jgi:hypothetical protein